MNRKTARQKLIQEMEQDRKATQSSIEVQTIDVVPVKESQPAIAEKANDFVAIAKNRINANLDSVNDSFTGLTETFGKLVAANDAATLQKLCGTMTHEDMTTSLAILEGVKRRQIYEMEAEGVKQTGFKVAAEKMITRLEEISQQIRVARKANQVAMNHDSLTTEVEERRLKQERQRDSLAHQGAKNNALKADEADELKNLKAKHAQKAIVRESQVKVWEAIAKVALTKSKNKTDWASTFDQTKTKETE